MSSLSTTSSTVSWPESFGSGECRHGKWGQPSIEVATEATISESGSQRTSRFVLTDFVGLGSHSTNRSAVIAGPMIDLDDGDQPRVALRQQT